MVELPGEESWAHDATIERIAEKIIEKKLFTKDVVLERIRETLRIWDGMLTPVGAALMVAENMGVRIPPRFYARRHRDHSFLLDIPEKAEARPVILQEYKINEHLSLRLVENNTVILVDGKHFNTCKRLILSIPVESDAAVENLDSIDAVIVKYPESRTVAVDLSPLTEFWGHCSNIQAWYEHGYDTRILHSNLSFPLLKRLADAGDSQANRVFKHEVIERLCSGFTPVIRYLIERGFLSHITADDWFWFIDEALEMHRDLPWQALALTYGCLSPAVIEHLEERGIKVLDEHARFQGATMRCRWCGMLTTGELTIIKKPGSFPIPCHINSQGKIAGDGSCPYRAFYRLEYGKARRNGINDKVDIDKIVKSAWSIRKKTILKAVVKDTRGLNILIMQKRTSVLPIIHERDLMPVLGIDQSTLDFLKSLSDVTVPDVQEHASLYHHFEIPKRRIGVRQISAPASWLARLQEKILRDVLERVYPHHACYSFLKRHSVLMNARVHSHSWVIWKIDLQDFFPSITNVHVMRVFLEIGYSQKVAKILANACTVFPRELAGGVLRLDPGMHPFLPQGACTSPYISNLVLAKMDAQLYQNAREYRFEYTRYADDLVFSSRRFEKVPASFMNKVLDVIKASGFHVNPRKNKIARYYQRQVVTGILVNDFCALPRPWVRKLRAALHHLARGDYDALPDARYLNVLNNIKGRVSYAMMVCDSRYGHLAEMLVRYQKTLGARRAVAIARNGVRQRHLEDFA